MLVVWVSIGGALALCGVTWGVRQWCLWRRTRREYKRKLKAVLELPYNQM